LIRQKQFDAALADRQSHFGHALSLVIRKTSALLLLKHAQVLRAMPGVTVLSSGPDKVEFEIEATERLKITVLKQKNFHVEFSRPIKQKSGLMADKLQISLIDMLEMPTLVNKIKKSLSEETIAGSI
jgi:hypothetical protein